jgi:hypothetical protein
MKKWILILTAGLISFNLAAQKKGFLQVQSAFTVSTTNPDGLFHEIFGLTSITSTRGYGSGFQLSTRYLHPLTKRIYATGGLELFQSFNNKVGYFQSDFERVISSQARSLQATAGVNIYLSSEKRKCRFFWQTQLHVPLATTIRNYQDVPGFVIGPPIFPITPPLDVEYKERVVLRHNPGFSTQIGAEWNINKNLQIHAGLQYRNQTVNLRRSKVTSYKENGIEKVHELNTYMRETVYTRYETDIPTGQVDLNAPQVRSPLQVNFNGIAVLGGVRIRL